MLQLILVAAIFVALFYYIAIKPMSYWQNRGVKQTKKVWMFGDQFRSFFKQETYPEMICRIYNQIKGDRYLGMYQLTLPTLIIKDQELIKKIGVQDFEYFSDHRVFIPADIDPLWGKNLVALTGKQWHETRQMVSPLFTGSKLRTMFDLMLECAENLTNFFLKKNQDSIDIEMKDLFTRYTNDVIATTAFGIKTDSLLTPNNEFYMMGKDAADFGSFKKMIKFFGYIFIPKLLHMFKVRLFEEYVYSYFTELIETNIKIRKEQSIVRPDLINLLMEAHKTEFHHEEKGVIKSNLMDSEKPIKKELTTLDIAAQAMVFFFAGFDTVSSLISFFAYELAINQDIQIQLRKEIVKTLEECKGKITYDALFKMKYMDMVLSETLRKWPTAIVIDRICTKPYTIEPTSSDEQPLFLDKGTVIWLPIYAIHRDPTIYPNPDRFDPERFNDDNKGSINPYSYLPFGVGPRTCIGTRFALMEIKLVMFNILSRFEIVPTAKTAIPLKMSKKPFALEADGGFNLTLKRLVK